jgi:hypothetical protein
MKRFPLLLFLTVLAMAQTKPKRTGALPNLSDTIEWLTGASQEEAGWGAGSFQFSSDGKCKAELSTVEIMSNAKSEKDVRRTKYSFQLADIDPSDIRFEHIEANIPYDVIEFHTYNYRESISFTGYKDSIAEWSPKEVESSQRLRAPFTSALRTNNWFAPRFVKAFTRAVELCGGKKSSY